MKKTINIDIGLFDKPQQVMVVKASNANSIEFVIRVIENGQPFDNTGAAASQIQIKKPDNTILTFLCAIDTLNRTFSATLPLNAFNAIGLYEVELQVTSGQFQLIVPSFYYQVKTALYDDQLIPTLPEYPILLQLIADVQGASQGETDRIAAENARVTAENNRVAAESARSSAEVLRNTGETNRNTAEATRISNDSARGTAEATRVSNETARGTAETTRNNQEGTRQSNETARNTAEATRVSSENTRGSNETSRQNSETTRINSENTRISNETARGTAESGRVTAESGRVTAESGRVTAENGRVSAESTRVNAETIRQQFQWRGAYSGGTAYVVNNLVEYNGSSYACILNSTGNVPTNTTYWRLVALKGTDGTGGGNAFGTIQVSGQSDIIADQINDVLTIVAGSNVTLTTNAATDTLTIAATGGGGNAFGTIAVSGQSDVVADQTNDILTLAAGSLITLTTNATTDTVTIATTANNYVHPNHSGDVTSVGDGAQTIANNAVTNAKAADMAVNTIKGRITAGTGDPEDLTAANVRTIINVADGAEVNQNTFNTIAVSGQSNVVADQKSDTLTLVAGTNITITTDPGTDAITINATGGGGNAFGTFTVSGQSNVVADQANDTLTLVAGEGISITTDASTDTITIKEATTITTTDSASTSYTLALTDAGKYLRMTSSTAITITIPLNSSVAFPTGSVLYVERAGLGSVTFSPTGGVTLNSSGGRRTIGAIYENAMLIKIATDTWELIGSLG